MNTVKLYEIGKRLRYLTMNAGATDAIVTVSSGTEKSVSVRSGELHRPSFTESASISLTAVVGEKSGSVDSSSLDSDDLEKIAIRAVKLARVATKNPYQRMATKDELPCDGNMSQVARANAALDAYDSSTSPTLIELKERALAFDATARSMPGVSRSEETTCGYSVQANVMLMSNGFEAVERYTHHSKSTVLIAENNSEMKTGDDYHATFHFEDLRSDESCARRASEYAVRQLGAKPIPTGKMPVIFDKEISRTLLSALKRGIDADMVYHKSTFLLNKLHERIFQDRVTIVEEPFLPRRLGSRYYDDEGVKTTAWTLVDNGVLRMWISDIESAMKLRISPTGHAGGASNLLLRPSAIARTDMIRDISRGLLVTQLMGHGADIATGAFSVGAEGFLIENGVITTPVNKVTIAGNLLDMYRELIPANDLSDHCSGANAPSCFVPSMMVGGT